LIDNHPSIVCYAEAAIKNNTESKLLKVIWTCWMWRWWWRDQAGML